MRTQVAAAAHNLDEFKRYTLQEAQGALQLGSKKRAQEVLTNWMAAQKIWPFEQRLQSLRDTINPLLSM
jgi:hypothetical protein